jgi:biopolymer transport protein ExbD
MAMSAKPSSAAGGEGELGHVAEINVTPLVDVMLVLLIIFIITIRVILHQVPLTLPKATNLVTQTKPENITIAVDKDGDIYWNTKELSGQDELLSNLRGIVAQDPQPEVHIRGDANVRYQYVGQVLVATQKIGIRKVAFITEPDHPGAGS